MCVMTSACMVPPVKLQAWPRSCRHVRGSSTDGAAGLRTFSIPAAISVSVVKHTVLCHLGRLTVWFTNTSTVPGSNQGDRSGRGGCGDFPNKVLTCTKGPPIDIRRHVPQSFSAHSSRCEVHPSL
jgi:hypothetical protein